MLREHEVKMTYFGLDIFDFVDIFYLVTVIFKGGDERKLS